MSHTLLKIYISHVLIQQTRKYSAMGINVNDFFLYTLLFADDDAVIDSNKEDASHMIRKLRDEYYILGLDISPDKGDYIATYADGKDLGT